MKKIELKSTGKNGIYHLHYDGKTDDAVPYLEFKKGMYKSDHFHRTLLKDIYKSNTEILPDKVSICVLLKKELISNLISTVTLTRNNKEIIIEFPFSPGARFEKRVYYWNVILYIERVLDVLKMQGHKIKKDLDTLLEEGGFYTYLGSVYIHFPVGQTIQADIEKGINIIEAGMKEAENKLIIEVSKQNRNTKR